MRLVDSGWRSCSRRSNALSTSEVCCSGEMRGCGCGGERDRAAVELLRRVEASEEKWVFVVEVIGEDDDDSGLCAFSATSSR